MKEIIERIKKDLQLYSFIKEQEIEENKIIFEEGEETSSLIIIEEGDIIIEKSINKEKTAFKELAYISAPSIIGEISLFETTKRTARARSLTKCKIIEISKRNFDEILNKKNDIANEILTNIIKILSLRLTHTSKELTLLYDISKHLSEKFTEEKEFLKTITDEILIYFDECEIEAFYYNYFNDEFEKIYETKLDINLNIETQNLKNLNNSTWIDNKTYISLIKNENKPQAIIAFIFKKELSKNEINDYTTIFNTISYIASIGLKEAAQNKEQILKEKLNIRKGKL